MMLETTEQALLNGRQIERLSEIDLEEVFTVVTDSEEIQSSLESINRLDVMNYCNSLLIWKDRGEWLKVYYASFTAPKPGDSIYLIWDREQTYLV